MNEYKYWLTYWFLSTITAGLKFIAAIFGRQPMILWEDDYAAAIHSKKQMTMLQARKERLEGQKWENERWVKELEEQANITKGN